MRASDEGTGPGESVSTNLRAGPRRNQSQHPFTGSPRSDSIFSRLPPALHGPFGLAFPAGGFLVSTR